MLLRSTRIHALRLVTLGLVPAAALVTAPINTVPAHAMVFWSGTCVVTATLTFDSPIRPVPQVLRYQLNGSSLTNCTSVPTRTGASFTVSGRAVASCDEVTTLFGGGAFSFTSATGSDVALAASSGSSYNQHWAFPGTNPTTFAASATLTWASVDVSTALGETENCYLHGGTSSMTLTGSLAYEDPSVT